MKYVASFFYVKFHQLFLSPGHYDQEECMGCKTPIMHRKSGLCPRCEKIDRAQYQEENRNYVQIAKIIRAHK